VEQYGVEYGLPNNIVNCSLKDRDGFMWFGTWYGLCSFDGLKFTSYNNRDGAYSDIPPRKIESIVEDKNGYLWIKTVDRKLYVFNKENERFHAVYNKVKDYAANIQVIKIQQTKGGEVLILTKDKNLLRSFETTNDQVHLKLLHNATRDINPQDSRLKYNVLFETGDCLGWIGQDYKIFICDKGEKLRQQGKDAILRSLPANIRTSFTCAFADERYLWLGDKQGFLYQVHLQNGTVTKHQLTNALQPIRDIHVSARGTVYAAVENIGIYEFRIDKKAIQRLPFTVGAMQKLSVFVDKLGKLWLVEDNKSVVYYDPDNKHSKRFLLNSGQNFTSLKYQDVGQKGLFFLTPAGEMMMFDRSNLSMIPLNKLKPFDDILPNQLFFDQMLDSEGILWLASTAKGVYRVNFPKNQFRLLDLGASTDNMRKTGIRALFEAKDNTFWVGNRNAILYRLNNRGDILQKFPLGDSYVGSAYHIMQDKENNLWISTKGDGLVKASADKSNKEKFRFQRFTHQPNDQFSLSHNDVYYSYCDSKGRIWIGTMGGGLNLLTQNNGVISFKNRFNCFKTYPSYGLYMEVRNIEEDQNGRIWVGTTDGLMSFDGNFKSPEQINFETYRNQSLSSNIADNDINVLYKDSESQIWISVFGGGLNRLMMYDAEKKRPVFETYGMQQGLNTDVIVSIVEDKKKNLWLATESGLSRFDKKTRLFRNYDKYDGFMNVRMEENSALHSSRGELWLGCKEGILMFDPDKLMSSNSSYKTFIVNFKISNKELNQFKEHPITSKSIKYAQSITLKHDQSMFSLEFAALNYYDPNRISYKYILDGYEKEWHFNGKNRIASYSNIPPGKYLFRVMSVDEAAPNLYSEKNLEIIVLPPWWKSWWAYTIYFIISVIFIYLALRLFFLWTKMKNDVYIGERLSELKIKFFTNISHELRTPLTLIKGPIQELKGRETLSPKGKEYIDLMERSTNQMQQLVNQLLDFRKIQNGKMRLHVSQINLANYLPYFEKEFHILAEEKQIQYTFHLSNEPLLVWADKERLGIVIRNVISNAFKFTPPGGEIHVAVGLTYDGKHVSIQVRDTGIGIEKTKLQEIFERFVQGNNERNTYYSGTGIGLALSKEIMLLHHGKIIAESPPSGGSIFSIELLLGKDHFLSQDVDFYVGDEDKISDIEVAQQLEKVASDQTQEQEKEEYETLDKDQPSLLLVEDNRDMANLVKMQLDGKYKVFLAINGVEGLKKIHLYHPDIVVTDQMMPQMDGIELLTHIRNDFQISHIPVIILTAKDGDESKTNAITHGANAYITKPFSKEYLMARIDQLLNERRLFRERLWQQREDAGSGDYEKFLETKDVQLLDQIHQVIEENMDNSEFNIDTIASNIGLSRSAFFKKLKSLTGLAPVDLVKEIRLNKSTDLLKNTDMSISEIAYAVGFKESGYYTKCFRKKYNQTPREYINEWRKG
jgi:signal transduction histidine kinase/ligand-binding sensor domain-containing protein/DNA-binding response OmpR family regulator